MIRFLFVIITLATAYQFSTAQSYAKVKLTNNQYIEGEWLGMENGHYMIGHEPNKVRYIPEEMVLKLKVRAAADAHPNYDLNKNSFLWGVSGEYNTTLGQREHTFTGIGGKLSAGYDFDHRYALFISVGFRDMNMGTSETFVPVSVTPVKYFTSGRILLFGGVEAGMNFGVSNLWNSSISNRTWNNTRVWSQPMHHAGKGPSLTPLTGIRIIGKRGIDHVLSLGLHLQKFSSDQKFEDDFISRVNINYRRWQISYGLIF